MVKKRLRLQPKRATSATLVFVIILKKSNWTNNRAGHAVFGGGRGGAGTRTHLEWQSRSTPSHTNRCAKLNMKYGMRHTVGQSIEGKGCTLHSRAVKCGKERAAYGSAFERGGRWATQCGTVKRAAKATTLEISWNCNYNFQSEKSNFVSFSQW